MKHRKSSEADATPPCYVLVHPGLEDVAAEEIENVLGGDVRKKGKSIVLFRLAEIDRRVLRLSTTEDVFVFAWGTDELSYRAQDLESIRNWTAKSADWQKLLQIHHAIRPKPKGKTTYRLVVQMTGEHGYRRFDVLKAFAKGLAGKLPASWNAVEENASVEIWLTIHGAMAICGIRLSDSSMRHRSYKVEHMPGSLRPSMAASMVRLAELKPGQVVVDPFCGAGTILAESILFARGKKDAEGQPWKLRVLGGDMDPHHVRFAQANLFPVGETELRTWDARRLPLDDASVDRVISNPPFGKQLSTLEEIGPLYAEAFAEMNRVLKPGGQAVLLVMDVPSLREAVVELPWKRKRFVSVRIMGQRAAIAVYRKGQAEAE